RHLPLRRPALHELVDVREVVCASSPDRAGEAKGEEMTTGPQKARRRLQRRGVRDADRDEARDALGPERRGGIRGGRAPVARDARSAGMSARTSWPSVSLSYFPSSGMLVGA